MPRLILPILISAATLAFAQKPVTPDDLDKKLFKAITPVWSQDDLHFAYEQDEKIWIYDVHGKHKRELFLLSKLNDAAAKPPKAAQSGWTNRRVDEQTVQWFADGRRLLVLAEGDLFLVEADSGRFESLTHTEVQEKYPKLSPDNSRVSFVREHDLYVMELASKKVTQLTQGGTATLLNGELDWVYPEELDLGTAFWWSPDSRYIAYFQMDTHNVPTYPHSDVLVNPSVYEPERYPKAGDPNPEVRVGVVSAAGGTTRWMDLGDTRNQLIARVTWFKDSQSLALMRLNRIQNNLDLLKAEAETGKVSTLIHESDPYWINVVDEPYFLKDGFIWESERTGYRHLYLYSLDGTLKRALTQGDWPVDELVGVDEEKGEVTFSSNKVSPIEEQLYRVSFSGGEVQQLTNETGVHSVKGSPKGQYFTDTFSSIDSAPRQVLRESTGKEVAELASYPAKELARFTLSKPEIVTLKASDGSTLYGRLTKPVAFDPAKKYPVIVQVYGGPHAQTVRKSFSGVNQEQVFAGAGFVVWQLDNRGTWGRGHKFESAIFRQLGVTELEDQKVGVDYLKKLPFVNANKIGITGWSYGGFMTLNCLLNAPDYFQAGVAGAPVTDMRNYDTIYTERYMDVPERNQEGYKRSSNTNKAANLKAKLLLIHNLEDDNVHFQNTMQMANALELANKQFRMLIYPQKTHGVTGPAAKHLSASILDFMKEALN